MNASRTIDDDTLTRLLGATRLTQSGRLHEATAAIQRALGVAGLLPTDTANDPLRRFTAAPGARGLRDIEGVRVPADETARSTGAPCAGCAPTTGAGTPAGTPAAAHAAPTPESLGGVLGDLRALPGLAGLAESLAGVLKRPPAAGRPAWQDIVQSALRTAAVADPLSDSVVLPEGARFLTESYSGPAGSRNYRLYIPSSHQAGEVLPLVVMLHGCTQGADDFAAGTRMNALAEERRCFVAYPIQTQGANMSKCWNWFRAEDQQRDHGEPAIIAGITRQLIATYPVDAQRVYVAGLSAGGAMAAIMGATYPDLYAAIGVHSGLAYGTAHDMPSAFAAMQGAGTAAPLPAGGAGSGSPPKRVPTIVFHGDRDSTVHPRNGDQVIAQWASAAANDGTYAKVETPLHVSEERGQAPNGHAYTRSVHRDASGHAIVEQWLIHGASHAWAGGSSSGSYTDPNGPDASQEMLRFFYQHML